MPIEIKCDRCQTRYRAADDAAGKRLRCRKCGITFTVRMAGASRVEAASHSTAVLDDFPMTSRPGLSESAQMPEPPEMPAPAPARSEKIDWDAIEAAATAAAAAQARAEEEPPAQITAPPTVIGQRRSAKPTLTPRPARARGERESVSSLSEQAAGSLALLALLIWFIGSIWMVGKSSDRLTEALPEGLRSTSTFFMVAMLTIWEFFLFFALNVPVVIGACALA